MSKERLEEARLMAEMLRVETRLPHDFPFDLVDWLVEQAELVEKLEEEVDRLNGALHFQLSEENIKNERIRKLHRQNRRYLEAIEDIKKTWKNPHNPYNQLDEIHEIIKELEESK